MSSLAPDAVNTLRKVMRRAALTSIGTILLMALLVVLVGCEGTRKPLTVEPPDPAWTHLIAAHSSGVIARKSAVRIVFTRNVASEAQVGQPLERVLLIEPRIEGVTMFDSRRELVFKPKTEFAAGTSYRFSLRPRDLVDVPKTLPSYQFVVRVQPAEFDVRFEGLSAHLDANAMLLRGELRTADVEETRAVEQLLSATLEGRAVKIDWQHVDDSLRHRFTVASLERGNSDRTLRIAWTGQSIGADTHGSRDFIIPAAARFTLTQVAPAQDGGAEQHVIAYFSDALDTKQDLRGLVRVQPGTARLRIEGNLLHVYLSELTQPEVQLTLDGAIRNHKGQSLPETSTHHIAFEIPNPQVRWVGNGVILPERGEEALSIPFEAVNLRSVRVTALQIFENNLPQFLQVNKLDGQRELGRVGRTLWRKTISLATSEAAAANAGRWTRYSLDVSELMQKHPGSLVRLTLSFRKRDIVGDCAGDAQSREGEVEPVEIENSDAADAVMWNDVQYDYEAGETLNWHERNDPCKPAYYFYGQNVRAARNLLVSNFGLMAKRDPRGGLLVAITDLRNAEPIAGATLTLFNFQNQEIARVSSDAEGLAKLNTKTPPALLIAEKGGQKGYLRLAPGVALSLSHFDVGGEKVAAGIKATLYGERGVWRPGDDIHLTLALQDLDERGAHLLPKDYPITLELFDPQQRLVQSVVNDKPVGGFYAFKLQTAASAPTGDWTAKATVGGSTFTKTLKIETVMPNRLKIDLQMNALDTRALKGEMFAQWLTGATAANLHADVQLKVIKANTTFDRYPNFEFDDPARELGKEAELLFEGELDAQGRARIEKQLTFDKQAPGKLEATLISRVFERGGAFSIARQPVTLSPYERYIGVRVPKGNGYNGALIADTPHTIDLASVDADGQPLTTDTLEIKVYRIDWRWWWDHTGGSLAQYTASTHAHVVAEGGAKTTQGAGQWTFTVRHPEWGRYLVRVCDTKGGHCAGSTFYIDWPDWAGRPADRGGNGATVLTLATDKNEYTVGDIARIDLPSGAMGRALLTIENGSRVLSARWIDVRDTRRIDVPITAAMAPNVYVSVQLLQPHANKQNDRPLRMLGIVPIKVSDPRTHLQPMIQTAAEWRPETTVKVTVAERTQRAMHYTLAIVDEGLLGLTNFKTPELHAHFYKREALGVATWDVFDEVIGGYGAKLERLLALGGSDDAQATTERDRSRFPPVVTFLGPFALAAGASATHEVQLPQYIGALRVMVVAGHDGAYGSTETTVPVRQPLMMLPTLPRSVGPDEEIAVPISIFVADASIQSVNVSIAPDEHFAIVGERSTTVKFQGAQEQLALLKIKSLPRVGKARIAFAATSGAHQARAEIYLDVRSPNSATVNVQQQPLKAGETWRTHIKPHGLAGTNTVTLEVSAFPPLNLERHLDYLIHYPYGCLEQTVSSVFPQLFLPAVTQLDAQRKRAVEVNVRAGIERLRESQHSSGGFAYWPGAWMAGDIDPRGSWSTTYAGHFLIEAERQGYRVPPTMLSSWMRFQRNAAQSWTTQSYTHALDQAYRLYTLALVNQADIGAMNRLREMRLSTPERWLLAASYRLAGLSDAAHALLKDEVKPYGMRLQDYPYPDDTFSSRLRDAAIVLTAALALGEDDVKALVEAISGELSSDRWHSTHSLSFSLMAMSRLAGESDAGPYTFEYSAGKQRAQTASKTAITRIELSEFPDAGAEVNLKNTANRTLFASIAVRGVPRAGEDSAASSGLSVSVDYLDTSGQALDVRKLSSGGDFIMRTTVKNAQPFAIKNIALTQIVPAGWEIHNDRLDGVTPSGERSQPRALPWYYGNARNDRKAEYVDIRDDRVNSFFALNPGESIEFVTHLNAAYAGRFYLASIAAEAMYDASKYARTSGQWVEVEARK